MFTFAITIKWSLALNLAVLVITQVIFVKEININKQKAFFYQSIIIFLIVIHPG